MSAAHSEIVVDNTVVDNIVVDKIVVDNIIVDSDGDGLIDITTLEQLDWMRNNVFGTALVDFSGNRYEEGCPGTGCFGYELMADLSFDTNDDGVISPEDEYYDYDGDGSNSGWLPIGTLENGFQAHFEGNGHRISGLYIHRQNDDVETQGKNIGLFGVVTTKANSDSGLPGASINRFVRNLSVSTAKKGVSGVSNVGVLIGKVNFEGSDDSTTALVDLENINIIGFVNGEVDVGGIIGEVLIEPWYVANNFLFITESQISIALNSTIGNAAGMIGLLRNDHRLTALIKNNDIEAEVAALGNGSAGGVIGYFDDYQSAGGKIEIIDNTLYGHLDSKRIAGGVIGEGVGFAANLELGRNIVMGSVTALSSAGGLIGWSYLLEGRFDAYQNRVFSDIYAQLGCSGGIVGDHIALGADVHTHWKENISYGTVSGGSSTGGLVGCYKAYHTEPVASSIMERNIVVGNVRGEHRVGGFMGSFLEGDYSEEGSYEDTFLRVRIHNNMVAGRVFEKKVIHDFIIGKQAVGGFVGSFVIRESSIKDVFVNNLSLMAVRIKASERAGGFFGLLQWRDDVSTPEVFLSGNYHFNQRGFLPSVGELNAPGLGTVTEAITEQSVFGARYVDLKYPEGPNAWCDAGVLYESWDEKVWSFGRSDQFPGLIIDGVVYRYNKKIKTLEEEMM
ncbi:hypothetical protein [Marinibactrum halimedae]|nr:hypothetical protein [Marinibactrum halimedae]MCD9460422.1 hypothetical protein [Marinibactrum halimedae]